MHGAKLVPSDQSAEVSRSTKQPKGSYPCIPEVCARWKCLSYRQSSAQKMLFYSWCFWAYLSTKILRRMSLNNSNHGYSSIKESVLEFVWNGCQEQPENVLYSTLQPAASDTELRQQWLL